MTNDDVLKEFDKQFSQLHMGYPVGTFGERIKSFFKAHLEAAYERGASDMRDKAIAEIEKLDRYAIYPMPTGEGFWGISEKEITEAIAALPIDEKK